MAWALRSNARGALIGHGNISISRVVFNGDRPTGLIGWEFSGPVDPITKVAVAASNAGVV